MADSWMTKDGARRVGRNPPTLAEAIEAAQGLTPDADQQVRFAADLMGVNEAEVRIEVRRTQALPRAVSSVVAPTRDKGARLVVVERRLSRRRVEPPAVRTKASSFR